MRKKILILIIMTLLLKLGSKLYPMVIKGGSGFSSGKELSKSRKILLRGIYTEEQPGASWLQKASALPEAGSVAAATESPENLAQLYTKQQDLAKKVLLDEQEKHFLAGLAENPRYRDSLFQKLKVAADESFLMSKETERIEAIAFIEALLRQSRLNTQALMIGMILEVIEDPLFTEIKDVQLRKSILGDKSDLIALLKRCAPEEYQQFVEEAKIKQNRWLAYLIHYSDDHS